MSEQPRKPKTYAPLDAKARQDRFDNTILAVGGKAEDLITWIRERVNSRGYINLTIAPRRQASERGSTHSVYLDDWEPRQQRGGEDYGEERQEQDERR